MAKATFRLFQLVVALLVMSAPAFAGEKLCHMVVATDAPNPTAIFIHEQAHCWGWTHAAHDGRRLTKGYKAHMPTGKWLKPYPVKQLDVQFERMRDVPAICGTNEQFGCQWFD